MVPNTYEWRRKYKKQMVLHLHFCTTYRIQKAIKRSFLQNENAHKFKFNYKKSDQGYF